MILITGGTGFVGQEVVGQLLDLGYKVRLLVRDPQRARQFAGNPRVEVIKGDLLQPDTLPAAVAGVQAVIHLVGILVETPKISYRQAHVEATANLLKAARAAGVTRWLQMSACGTRPYGCSQYHLTKWEAERLVQQSGLDWTIFRPSLIYGHDERDRLLLMVRKVLSWPFGFLACYSFPLLDGGRPLVQPVSVREVARCFAVGLSKEKSIGEIYEVVGPVPISWREMVSKIVVHLGKHPIYEEVPILLILRKWLWIAIILIPVAVAIGLAAGGLTVAHAEMIAAVWAVLAFIAHRWTELILFNVPGEPLWAIADGLDMAPQGLRFGGLLKMAGEDNIGDPAPAAKMFDYEPETFEQGLKNLYDR
jgi:NADH dehydrogenase